MTTRTTKATEAQSTMSGDDITRETMAAINEATKIASETARRSAEAARASVDVTRSFMGETSDLNGDVAGAWAAGGETALKSVFEAQNAAMDLSSHILDVTTKANRRALGQMVGLVGQGQKAALAGLQAWIKAFEQMTVEVGGNGKRR